MNYPGTPCGYQEHEHTFREHSQTLRHCGIWVEKYIIFDIVQTGEGKQSEQVRRIKGEH